MPIVAALVLAGSPPGGARVRNDDAAVIRAAMASFFAPTRERWAGRGSWDRGSTVVIGTQLRARARASIAGLGGILEQDWDGDRMAGAPSFRLARAAASRLGTFRPPAIVPLRTLDLGPRTVVADAPWPDVFRFDPPLPQGRKGGGRAWLRLYPPAYSGDGRIAALKTNANSAHGSEILFVLRREGAGWRVLYVEAKFFA